MRRGSATADAEAAYEPAYAALATGAAEQLEARRLQLDLLC